MGGRRGVGGEVEGEGVCEGLWGGGWGVRGGL